jgi:mono/diheme cytochrome c family protein
MKIPMLFIAIAGSMSLWSGVCLATDDPVDYLKQVKPILRERCYACHGALKQEGGLRLDTAALAIKGGDSGTAIKPGDAAASLLLERISATEEAERMPPEGEPLKPAQIEALRRWITQKAVAPKDERPERDPREHWAFKTPTRPPLPQRDQPTPEQARWQQNPIDAFIANQHRKQGIVPQSDASKRVWLRRVSLDLIGLPPTKKELDTFTADQSPEAFDKVVTRLLESPQYGQRWGRHWMDIWRYSDWWGLGAEVRNSQKHIWHWRDWIIESLNEDKGYDQMLREMLAADELYPNDLEKLRATGFLARQYFIFNRTAWLDETIEHSAKAMLGLTFNCAKCHDHKYDPLTQAEYYKLRAIFEPYQIRMEMVPGQTDFEKDGIPRVFDAHLDVPTYLHVRGDDRNPDKSVTMKPAVPAFLSSDAPALAIKPVSLPAEATYPGLREFVVKTHRDLAEQQVVAARSVVVAAAKKLAESQAVAKKLAAKDAATKPTATKPITNQPTGDSKEVLVRDDFSVAKPDVWEQRGGKWKYANGKLTQSETGASRATLRLKRLPPADFEARLKYIPTGGDMWKSVGISFDVTADGNELMAYVSSVVGGQKSQISFKQGGKFVYPPTAAQARKVELNQPHEIVLRVRGALLNMRVDGEHSIAYRLPANLKRKPGFLELIAFDAKVDFVSFELQALPKTLKLVDVKAAQSKPATKVARLPVDQAQLALTIAEKALKTAEAQLASIKARAAADRVRHTKPEAGQESATKGRLLVASKFERIVAALRAEENVSRAELALMQVASDKKADAQKKLAAANVARDKTRKAIDVPSETYTSLPGAKKTQEDYQNRNAGKPFPTTSTGRRSAFAKWMTDPRHPLPARVAVNHIWMRHMGAPLVPTVFDFGRKGTPPTHPELLDWLAVELIENNWSMKHIHRLIVTSQAYRLSSSSAGVSEATKSADPDNQFYWRMNPVRMEAQIVRDSLLSLAGELDVSLGGPSIAVNNKTSRRRSLYFVHSHNDHQKFLSMFDDAGVLDCYRRAESIVPQQALALENSPFATEMAGKISQRIAAFHPDASDADFIRTAFVTILAVEPTSDEQATLTELLKRMTELAKAKNRTNPTTAARTSVVHTILNHNDFITIR